MVDDSEGKAISGDDCHMTPVREDPPSGPIHRLQFFDPVLCGLPRFPYAISPEYCLVKGCQLPLRLHRELGNQFDMFLLSVNNRVSFFIAHGTYLLVGITPSDFWPLTPFGAFRNAISSGGTDPMVRFCC